jgi:hypothetical protein
MLQFCPRVALRSGMDLPRPYGGRPCPRRCARRARERRAGGDLIQRFSSETLSAQCARRWQGAWTMARLLRRRPHVPFAASPHRVLTFLLRGGRTVRRLALAAIGPSPGTKEGTFQRRSVRASSISTTARTRASRRAPALVCTCAAGSSRGTMCRVATGYSLRNRPDR